MGSPPNAVSDLSVSTSYARGLTLTWTAPYDEPASNTGKAASYDLRYADAPAYPTTINTSWFDANWAAVQKAAKETAPLAGGQTQSFTLICAEGVDNNTCGTTEGNIILWPNTLYYAAMRSADDDPNTSATSNVIAGHTALKYGWTAFSLPYDWQSAAALKKLSDIFGDDTYGPYVFKWDSTGSGSTNGQWVDVYSSNPNINTLTNGKGYYIYGFNMNSVLDEKDSTGAPLVTENSATPGFVMVDLELGYNLIGSPYLMNVAVDGWTYICTSSGGTVTGWNGTACAGTGTITTYTYASAVTATLVSNSIYYHTNQSTYAAEPYASAKLRPWWGMWVQVTWASAPADPDGTIKLIIKRPP